MDKSDPGDAKLAHAEIQVAWLDKLKTSLFEPLDGKKDRVLTFGIDAQAHAHAHCVGQSPAQSRRLPYAVGVGVASTPECILDAPQLENDFYLNLLDWSVTNWVGIGLGTTLHVWKASDSTHLQFSSENGASVSSVRFSPNGDQVAAGQHNGRVVLYDVGTRKLAWTSECRTQSASASTRVPSIAWMSQFCFATGSRRGPILLHDTRTNVVTCTLEGHAEEICGLRWSPDQRQLASGANDNRVMIWDPKRPTKPILCIKDFKAAVKALAWNPTRPSLLATGAGTADRHLRFYNTQTGTCLQKVDTKAQVSSIEWSHDGRELISAHGFSHHHLVLWAHAVADCTWKPKMELAGHTARILSTALSPDGSVVASAAADEVDALFVWCLSLLARLYAFGAFGVPTRPRKKRNDGHP